MLVVVFAAAAVVLLQKVNEFLRRLWGEFYTKYHLFMQTTR